MLAFYLAQMKLDPGASVLHIAPEKGLFDYFSSRWEISDYVVADFNPEQYAFTKCRSIDLCNLESWPSDQFDLIVHSHVLEHTTCNIAYTIYHLHRMLKRNGRHVFVVPFASGKYEESFRTMSNAERTQRFGQWDHVRRFGCDDIDMHLGKIVRLPSAFDATSFATVTELEQANIPKLSWTGINPSTVIDLAKNDYLLSR
ncbi:methyltransferase domain-containing protein [Pseudorhodoplanes sp.]|uniref:methyltransferase domain-containing protein n=1 Tax=Pseudorhodoplanes sp. TaxID=1934341 RepID=UPI003D1303A4